MCVFGDWCVDCIHVTVLGGDVVAYEGQET